MREENSHECLRGMSVLPMNVGTCESHVFGQSSDKKQCFWSEPIVGPTKQYTPDRDKWLTIPSFSPIIMLIVHAYRKK